MERRLRRRRQEARIRARLVCDGAILLAHHACTPPSAPQAQPRALALLREQLEALQVRFNDLLAVVLAMGSRDGAPKQHAGGESSSHEPGVVIPDVVMVDAMASVDKKASDAGLQADRVVSSGGSTTVVSSGGSTTVVSSGGSATLVSSGIAAELDALSPLSVAAGGSTTVDCVWSQAAAAGASRSQLEALGRSWGYGRVWSQAAADAALAQVEGQMSEQSLV